MQQRSVRGLSRTLQLVAAVLCAAGSLASWFLYFTLYWLHRDKFNETGRYIDETTLIVYHEQSGALLIPALALSVLALVLFFWWARR